MKKLCIFILIALILCPVPITAQDTKEALKKTESTLTKEITVSESLQMPAKIIFGIEKTVSISLLVIIIMAWIIMFLILTNVFKFMLKGWMPWAAAVATTTIIGVSGTLKAIAGIFLNFGATFEFLEKWSAGAVTFALITVLFLGFMIIKILNIVKSYAKMEQAKQTGEEIGAEIGFAKSIRKMFTATK